MRLLHITDLHFRTPWYNWLAMEAPRFEACYFSGDFLDFLPTAPVSLREQSRWMRSWLKAFPGKIYACTGNHDWWMPQEYVTDNDARGGWLRKAASANVRVDGTSEIFQGHRFICCPWLGVPVVTGPEPAVVLVHSPPLGTPQSSDLGQEVGDPEVAAAVLKLPEGSLVLSGHTHNPKRWCHQPGPAWCFNPGVDFHAQEPNHVVIDTTARTAEFHGWGSVQRALLGVNKR